VGSDPHIGRVRCKQRRCWPRQVPRREVALAPDAQLDEWTEAFEADEERRKEEAAAAAAGDGWTVVARKGVQPPPALCL
jgi:hypothetical protein